MKSRDKPQVLQREHKVRGIAQHTAAARSPPPGRILLRLRLQASPCSREGLERIICIQLAFWSLCSDTEVGFGVEDSRSQWVSRVRASEVHAGSISSRIREKSASRSSSSHCTSCCRATPCWRPGRVASQRCITSSQLRGAWVATLHGEHL